MMKIKEIKASSIITKSNLPDADYVINPYIGCMHSCLYCYARFMKKITGHTEEWGKFVDVKVNAPDLIPAYFNSYSFLVVGNKSSSNSAGISSPSFNNSII